MLIRLQRIFNFDCSILLYYQPWMFYNYFIVILYHFLVLTYWHSAQCQLLFSACFLHRRKSIPDGVQIESKCNGARQRLRGCSKGSTTHQGAPGGPGAPWWVVPTSGAPGTASLLYKYTNIPETLKASTKYSSAATESRTTRSNLDTISDGVHHLNWCLSDDAWVVLCRPLGP